MQIFGISLVMGVAAIDDEHAMLSARAIKVHDDAEASLSDMTLSDHCTAAYPDEADQVACGTCITHTVSVISGAGGAHAQFMNHHLSKERDLVRSPAFMSELAVCLAGSGILPAGLQEEAAICGALFGGEACARAAGHCFAVHHPGACSTADVSGCKEDHGFLACIATQLDHDGCNHSPIGVGGCMACGLGCLKEAGDAITMATLASEQYQTCHATCQEPPAATAGAFELCHKFYGPDALQKCGGCAMQAKATAVDAEGKPSSCIGDQCLGIPSFIVAMTTCMMVPESLDCAALELTMVPLPYQGAEAVCQKAFPNAKNECMASGAHCLALHPCKGLQECADHDGWFNCFATQMNFDLCNMHPQGVAKCMQCGATCLEVAGCAGARDQQCVFGEAFLACHRGCASCSTGAEPSELMMDS